MSPRRPPHGRDQTPDDHDDPRPGSALDTVEQRAKLSGRRRPPPARGLAAIMEQATARRRALVVGALPAHVEVVFELDERTTWTRADVKIVRVHPALIATINSALVVGDEVTVAELSSGQLYVVEAQPRRTLLARPAIAREQLPQPLVANADTLWIVVAAAHPAMNAAMVDRFLVAAAAGGLVPRLCVTKSDLEGDAETTQELVRYEQIGFRVVRTSVQAGVGLAEMREALAGAFSVLVGESGVGKSSIVRAILPQQPIAVGEVSAATGKGRHTTTVTRYYRLDEGGAVVDTPGLRELGLWGATRDHLNTAFPDIAERAAQCRFDDCRHETEPGCAVRGAANVPDARLASFRKLGAEIDQRQRPGFGKPGGPTATR